MVGMANSPLELTNHELCPIGFHFCRIVNLPETRHYETVAGFVIEHLERIPQTGGAIEFENWRFEVEDIDHRRVNKVLASRI